VFAYSNPYTGQNFIGFLLVALQRLGNFLTGNLSKADLATDEVQLLVLIGVALLCAWVGTFLVLRRMTMLANALSHTILLGIVLSFLLLGGAVFGDEHGHIALNTKVLLLASLGMGVVTTFATEFLTCSVGLQEDASTGVVFTTFFALGIVLVTAFSRNAHIGVEAVMGNVDALHVEDVRLVWGVLLANLLLFILFFKECVATTFDPLFSSSVGISATIFNYLLMVQVAMTAVAAFRAVGVLMVLAFFTGPVLAARLFTHRMSTLLTLSSFFGVVSAVIGVALSRHVLTTTGVPLSTGGLTVSVMLVLYFASALLWLWLQRRNGAQAIEGSSTHLPS
jgi:manganese/zinc/iron transport system permease protein